MDAMKAVTYPFKDRNWVIKLLMAYVGLVPFVGTFFIAGFQIKTIRENAREEKEDLPEWSDWGTLLIDGFLSSIIAFFYVGIPVILLSIALIPFIVGLMVSFIGLSLENEVGQIIGILGSIGPLASIILLCVGSIWILVGLLLLPMAIGVYAGTGSIFGAINFLGITGRIFANFGNYVMVLIVPFCFGLVWGTVMGAIAAIPFIGQIIICIVPFLALPLNMYISLVSGKLIGDMFRESSMMH